MGEVYRARYPPRRSVAVKVIPDAFAQDPGRMTRFHRESQVLAALNHPISRPSTAWKMGPHLPKSTEGNLHVTVMVNWFDEVRRRVPSGQK